MIRQLKFYWSRVMKVTRFYKKLNEIFEALADGHIEGVAVNTVADVLTHHDEITPGLIDTMLQSPIADDFFDNPFYFPFSEATLEYLNDFHLFKERFVDGLGHVTDKKLAQKFQMEENLIELVTRIIDKQEEFKGNFTVHFNKIIGNRLKTLEGALGLIEDKIESLQKRLEKPGFFDTQKNLQAKISRLQSLKKELYTTYMHYFMACEPPQLSEKMAGRIEELKGLFNTEMQGEIEQLKILQNEIEKIIMSYPQFGYTQRMQREQNEKEWLERGMVSLFPLEEPIVGELELEAELLLQHKTTALVNKAHIFLQGTEKKLSEAFSKAMSYTLIEAESDRHGNPLMKFLDKVYHYITSGFGHVLTDTESVIDKAEKSMSPSYGG